MLEPFGEANEKPKLCIYQKHMNVEPMGDKTFKHYKCFTKNNNTLIAFNFYNQSLVCKSLFKNKLFVDLGTNIYRGKEQRVCYVKGLEIVEPKFSNISNEDFLSAIYNLYYSTFDFNNKEKYHVVDDIKNIIKQNPDGANHRGFKIKSQINNHHLERLLFLLF